MVQNEWIVFRKRSCIEDNESYNDSSLFVNIAWMSKLSMSKPWVIVPQHSITSHSNTIQPVPHYTLVYYWFFVTTFCVHQFFKKETIKRLKATSSKSTLKSKYKSVLSAVFTMHSIELWACSKVFFAFPSQHTHTCLMDS